MSTTERARPLPDPLPANPMPTIEAWLADAAQRVRNPTAMAIATSGEDRAPSVRMVLVRGFNPAAGWFVFYTDRGSAKGRHLDARPRAAGVFYWEPLDRQLRVEGPVTRAPDADVDAYWFTRPTDARVAAIATWQSRPIASRAELLARVRETGERLNGHTPRPERWVGYRLWIERVELWVSQPARIHDRAVWARTLTPDADGFSGSPWTTTRLEP
jgi:pyridoxamine 5'-phosphate oxidase